MENTDLFVNLKKMYNDGGSLIDCSSTISSSITDINNLLSKEWNSWLGADSDAYVNSLKTNLETLTRFCSEVNHIGSYMQEIASDYEASLTKGLGELSNNE